MEISKLSIKNIKKLQLEDDIWVYDVQICSYPNNFFANNILVHNSIFLDLNNKSDDFLYQEMKKFKQHYKKNIVDKHNNGLLESYFITQLQYQKHLAHLYLGKNKKRYYGIMDNGKKYIHGINIIRKDCPIVLRKQLDLLIQYIVRQKFTLETLLDSKNKLISTPYNEIGIFKRFNMPFEMYVKNTPQLLKAAFWANNLLNLNIIHTDVVMLFYIVDLTNQNKKNKNIAICLKQEDLHLIDQNKDKFIIDYDLYFHKQVIIQLEQFQTQQSIKVIREYKQLNNHYYHKTAPKNFKCPKCQRTHSNFELAQKCIKKIDRENKKLLQQCINYLKSFGY